MRKLYLGILKFRKDISKTPFQVICIDLEKQHQISTSKSEQSKQNTTKLDFHWISIENKFIGNKSEPAKHLADNEELSFLWSILLAALKDGRTRKNLEAFFIAKLKPSLNRQEDSNILILFRISVTAAVTCPLYRNYSKLTIKIQNVVMIFF